MNGDFITEVSALFYNNKAIDRGGAILLKDVNSTLFGSITFNNNPADTGGALHILGTNISFNVNQSESNSSSSIIAFQRNGADYNGGAIESYRSSPVFTMSVFFEANTAHYYGGEMSLSDTSKLILVPRLNISFTNNLAYDSGGALHLGIETCFYDGIDIYAYSWFQFLFPFYVWFLVGCIIVACRYSQ